jgi:NAD(P)-dependent dehydrogenase (short-subunit alcohol dehydrogenase family)
MMKSFNEFQEDLVKRPIDYQRKNRFSAEKASRRGNLMGKVVLLVAYDINAAKNLVSQLALKGADIALVGRQYSPQSVQNMNDEVESFGQRFLFIRDASGDDASAGHTIDTILSTFGRIDLFIDFSAEKRTPPTLDDKFTIETFLTDWQLMEAALKEIAR